MNEISKNFVELVKSWRAQSGVSQLELALRCDVSQKHISFLESARNTPSRSMVMLICDALDIPLRDRNQLMLSAGFAPAYKESDLSEPEMSAVNAAISMMLDQQLPYPAVVVDSFFNIVNANEGAMKLQCFLFDVDNPEELPAFSQNIMRGLFDRSGYGKFISNWDEIVPCLLRRLQSEVYASPNPKQMEDFISELTSYEGVPKDWKRQTLGEWESPIMTVNIAKDGIELSFFSTIATLGTPLDVTLQEIRIENYFPANEETKSFFSKL